MIGDTVTLYTCGQCPQCKASKEKLNKLGIIYRERKVIPYLRESVDAIRKATGFSQHPTVALERDQCTTAFTGYRPDLIERLADEINGKGND